MEKWKKIICNTSGNQNKRKIAEYTRVQGKYYVREKLKGKSCCALHRTEWLNHTPL